MDLNADFTKRVVLHSADIPWEDSPMPGVTRRRLDRVDTDDERVTTIVRYAPGSKFSSHVHTGGEEFIVLDGVFQDDYGDWPVGSYIRNPPQSKHTPGSDDGCTIFVKLWQFQPDDRTFVHANLDKLGAIPDRDREGANVSPLYKDQYEDVRLERWDAGSSIEVDATGGAELFVLDGTLTESGETLSKHSWLRSPVNTTLAARVGAEGAVVWIKTGHLKGL